MEQLTQLERARREARSSDRSLEQANSVHASLDRQREQVDRRTAEIEQAQEVEKMREGRNPWRMLDRDRGDFER